MYDPDYYANDSESEEPAPSLRFLVFSVVAVWSIFGLAYFFFSN